MIHFQFPHDAAEAHLSLFGMFETMRALTSGSLGLFEPEQTHWICGSDELEECPDNIVDENERAFWLYIFEMTQWLFDEVREKYLILQFDDDGEVIGVVWDRHDAPPKIKQAAEQGMATIFGLWVDHMLTGKQPTYEQCEAAFDKFKAENGL